MHKKLFTILAIIFFIIISFLLGYFFEQSNYKKAIENINRKIYTVKLKKTKDKLEIENPNKNIQIIMDNKLLTESGIIIEK